MRGQRIELLYFNSVKVPIGCLKRSMYGTLSPVVLARGAGPAYGHATRKTDELAELGLLGLTTDSNADNF